MSDFPSPYYWQTHERLSTGTPGVAVTGIGLICGLNRGFVSLDPPFLSLREEAWSSLKAGRSAIRRLDWTGHDPDGPHFGAGLTNGPTGNDPIVRGYLNSAVSDAVADAGLRFLNFDRDRAATVIGLSKGGMRSLDLTRQALAEGLNGEAAGRYWYESRPGFGAASIVRYLGLRGPSLAPIAACATGLIAILRGFDLIRSGDCDVAICGASDAGLEPLPLAAFRNMRALATDGIPRPWDRRRSGFVVGEGAAILVLERADHALARGALPYAEVSGGAMGSDAYHITDLNPDPTNLADLIGRALANSDLGPSDLDLVNVHGTATRVGDPLECRAIRGAFGSHADSLSCTSNKSQIGHLLGAAGAAEAAITCLSIRDGFVPPTLNLTDPDPACDLDGTPLVGRKREIRAALKLSIGFGGHLAAVVFRRPDGPRRGPIDA